jgi:hypothetical protein
MPINETLEQNSNGHCNVDVVFTLDQTNASFQGTFLLFQTDAQNYKSIGILK